MLERVVAQVDAANVIDADIAQLQPLDLLSIGQRQWHASRIPIHIHEETYMRIDQHQQMSMSRSSGSSREGPTLALALAVDEGVEGFIRECAFHHGHIIDL
jgi:hypothetical protein